MEPLTAHFLEGLAAGRADPDVLARAGEPDAARAARAFESAAEHPDLAGVLDRWVPPLLRAARPGFGADSLRALADARRAAGAKPLDLARTPLLPAVLGASGFLARALRRRPEWTEELSSELPGPPVLEPPPAAWDAIRSFKYRGLLRVAARDLAGRPFEKSLAELSGLADAVLVAALACAAQEEEFAPPALLALGKLGANELNFSSDVDLLFLYHQPPDSEPIEHRHRMARIVTTLKRELETPTPEGFGYRVDLDLRPEGRSGALALSVDGALRYYESFGAEWERQMLIRLRHVAGDARAAADFAREITPFVFRRAIDPQVMRRVRAMKDRIESQRRAAGQNLEDDLKEGPGGIRDVEFLAQSLQLFHGGRDIGVRSGNTLVALAALGERGLLPEATTAALGNAYLWLRRAAHALPLAEEPQTARFPRGAAAPPAVARRRGYDDVVGERARARLLDDQTAVRGEVRHHFEALVLRDSA